MANAYAPPRDPTNVLVRRVAAFAIDVVFLGVVGLILFATAKHRSYYDAPANACDNEALRGAARCLQVGDRVYLWENGAVARSAALTALAGFLDLVVLQALIGASVGKICLGLRVVDAEGREARFVRVLGRWAFLAVDAGCFLVGLITTVATRPHRRVGDLVCGTYVVAERSVGKPVLVLPSPPVGQAPPPPGYAPAGAGPLPAGWGTPAGWATAETPAPVATPPGTAPTTPGEWGAVARPGPSLLRAPQWESPPPTEPAPFIRSTMAPQWATPPEPTPSTEPPAPPPPVPPSAPRPVVPADAEPTAPPLAQWSPVVPLPVSPSTPANASNASRAATDAASSAEPASPEESAPPPASSRSQWRPVVPLPSSEPAAPVAPAEPAEPGPPPEPPVAEASPPDAPASTNGVASNGAAPAPEPVAVEPSEEAGDRPWWDSALPDG